MISFSVNEGKSIEDTIIITDVNDHFEGINAEYLYIEENFGKRGGGLEITQTRIIGGGTDSLRSNNHSTYR